MKNPETTAASQLMKMIAARWVSKPIYAAAELGIADILASGPKTVEELARLTRTYTPYLKRMMRALASVGIFSENNENEYELTPMAGLLKSGALRAAAILFNADWSDRAWSYFLNALYTGETPFEKAHGEPLSVWLKSHPEAARVFTEANAIKAANTHRTIVDHYDFSGIGLITDVGGGNGALLAEILEANPVLRGIVADQPDVIDSARQLLKNRELDDRCSVMECDFFTRIPSGSGAYLLSHILHDWPDERCVTILKNCKKAMRPDSRLLLVEMIVPPGNTPSVSKLLDMEMLAITGGRERTLEEYNALLMSAELTLLRVIETPEEISIVEAGLI